MDTLSTAEIQPLLQLAQATGLYTPAQFELIRERCVGFVNGQRADDYEVLVSRKDEVLSGFLIFRKRSLTQAAFEIGQIGSTDPSQIARLLEALRQEVLHRSGKLIFAELPDLPQWQPIHTTLQDTSYFVAGETPHVYAPGSGTRHYVLHLDRVTPEQTRMPVAVIHQPATPPAQPSTLTTVSVVPTVEAHRPAILGITATTSVFGADDQEIVQELLDLYLHKGLAEGYIFFSCLAGDQVIAYTCFGLRPSTVGTYDLYWICTDTLGRQQGAGRSLMQAVEAYVLKHGGYLVLLETEDTPAFTPTRKFYEAIGYTQIVHIDKFYSNTNGLVVYAKYLKPVE